MSDPTLNDRGSNQYNDNLIERLRRNCHFDDCQEAAKALEAKDQEIAELKRKQWWINDDQQELIISLGVRPIYWNGCHQAVLNGTNVPVKFFGKDKEACEEWCGNINKGVVDSPTQALEAKDKELERRERLTVKMDLEYRAKIAELEQVIDQCDGLSCRQYKVLEKSDD